MQYFESDILYQVLRTINANTVAIQMPCVFEVNQCVQF
jgi:hypothetical protein